jgi:F-box protein 21
MFLGIALFSSNRNSVPLISAIIYCYVVRQFGLQASPISYPFHVHALIQPPPNSTTDLDGKLLPISAPLEPFSPLTHLYMDPFLTADPISGSYLQNQLRFIAPNSTPEQITAYLSPSSARALTIRAAHNVLAAPNHYDGAPLFPIPMNAAAFGAMLALILLPSPAPGAAVHPAQISHYLSIVTQHFAHYFDRDVELFSQHVLPVARGLANATSYGALVQRLRNRDAMPQVPKLRSASGNEVVKFKVGQVFRHRIRGYLAVIYGWDSWCRMDEQWIVANGVDGLGKGRGQPFYNVL